MDAAATRSKPGKIGRVVATLGGVIARGELPPGTILPPEYDLERCYGASRGVVREAMKVLSAKGLVTVRARHGTQVRPRRDWGLLDSDVLAWIGSGGMDHDLLRALDEVRRIIEPAAAALAAARATADDRHRIAAAYAAMEATVHDLGAATAADKAFHLAILDAAGNPVLGTFRNGIEAMLGAVFAVAMPRLGGNLPNHKAVLDAIERGDAPAARAAMDRVLDYTQWVLADDGTPAR